jgi:hypothetical protein
MMIQLHQRLGMAVPNDCRATGASSFASVFLCCLLSGCVGPIDGDYRPVELSHGFKLIKTSSIDVVISEDPTDGESPSIPPMVVSVALVGDDVIIASQRRLNTGMPSTSRSLSPGELNYWILDTQRRSMVGPLSEAEMREKVHAQFRHDDLRFVDAEAILRHARDGKATNLLKASSRDGAEE